MPPPRSTIATTFSPDGKTLASTHGDNIVKIIDCHTGSCLKVLTGHRRTPWVVRSHPMHPEILASRSLDHEVRIWDANTAECIGSHDFYRPIASIAFHAKGELLVVASGHKLYAWHYSRRGETSSPTIILKTRRSLRAVHFAPRGAPVLFSAEVNDLDSSDSSMTRAISPGYLHYPPPAVFWRIFILVTFEFLGNVKSKERVVRTNVHGNITIKNSTDKGREERYTLWFYPSVDFHKYSILLTESHVIFYVDDVPIGLFMSTKAIGNYFITSPMYVYGSIWDKARCCCGGWDAYSVLSVQWKFA